MILQGPDSGIYVMLRQAMLNNDGACGILANPVIITSSQNTYKKLNTI
jgi:hypothetical protein